MIIRESGMPAQAYWETHFDVPLILDAFGFTADSARTIGDIVELGCGYGTFTVPLAQRIRGIVHSLDLEPAMVATTTTSATAALLPNIRAATTTASPNSSFCVKSRNGALGLERRKPKRCL